MKKNKEYYKDIFSKVLEDLKESRGEEYYDKDADFKVVYKENAENFYDKSIIKKCVLVYAPVPKDGWKGGNIIIDIDDDTGKAVTFVNTALGGRPITLPLRINENGKYFIPLRFE